MIRYRIEFGQSKGNRLKAQKFRQKVFRGSEEGLDEDKFDLMSDHCLIFDKKSNDKLVLVFRTRTFSSMEDILYSYPAQYYDLTKLSALRVRPMEIGRLCVDQHSSDPFLLPLAFKYLQSIVSNRQVDFMFGCTSFPGADNPRHLVALNSLEKNQIASSTFPIKKKSSKVLDIKKHFISTPDSKNANKLLPPLLRFYLSLGGRVSDHAVIDKDLDTLHVFTYVDLKEKQGH